VASKYDWVWLLPGALEALVGFQHPICCCVVGGVIEIISEKAEHSQNLWMGRDNGLLGPHLYVMWMLSGCWAGICILSVRQRDT